MFKFLLYEGVILLLLLIITFFMVIHSHKKTLRLLNLRLRIIYSISKSFEKFKSLKDISDYTLKLLVDTLEDFSGGFVFIQKNSDSSYSKFYDLLSGFKEVFVSDSFKNNISSLRHYTSFTNEELKLSSFLIYQGDKNFEYLHVIKFYLEDNSFGVFGLCSNKSKIDDLEYEFLRIVSDHFAFGVKSKHLSNKLLHFTKTIDVLENTYQKIVDNLPIGIVGVDNNDDYKIILWNELMENMFDVKNKDVYSKSILELFDKDSETKSIIQLLTKTSLTNKVQELSSFSVKTKKGLKYFLVLSYSVKDYDANFDGIVLVFKDITNQMSMENELRKSQEIRESDLRVKVDSATKELIDANNELKKLNNLKSEFVSIVSHELRTPLTSIRGYASLLLTERLGSLTEQQKNSVKVITDEGERLSKLINNLLDLSKLESGKTTLNLEEVNLISLIKESINSLEIQAEHKDISLTYSGRALKIHLDSEKIKQVLYNIAGNAIKFTPKGGSVEIKLNKNKNFAIISITDTGMGISKKDLKRIFEPFLQVESHLKRNSAGTGLGLTISKHIVELHHGMIEVESKFRKGSTFRIYIPRTLHALEDSNLNSSVGRKDSVLDKSGAVGKSSTIVDDGKLKQK